MDTKTALTLRAPEPSDIDIIYRWENDPALWHNSLTPPLTSRQQIWEYVHNFTGDIARDGSLRLMIQPAGSTEPAGNIDICDFNRRGNAAFVSIYVDASLRGRHIGTEALAQALTLAREALVIDTLAALKEAKRLGAKSLAVTNSIGSSIAREADNVVYTLAGPEIAVASTKAYTTQLVALLLLALYMGQLKGTLKPALIQKISTALRDLPDQIDTVLDEKEHMADVAEKLIKANDIFYLGRSIDYAIAMEGALKLKEVSYIHAESYAAGELQHGTLALISPETPVIAVATQAAVSAKMYSNIQEVRARGAEVLGIGFVDDREIAKYTTETVRIPRVDPFIAPILAVIPMQLLAYYTSIKRGNDVDKPRNLAKSVTVE